MARNYYVVLGVPADARPETIRSAYRRLARRFHPDRGEAGDARTFRELAEAYGVLSDPDRRASYDRQLHRPRPAGGPEPLQFELILSRDEARRGVRVPFRIPVLARCRACAGTGRDWVFPCEVCAGEGRRVDRADLDVDLPAGLRDGVAFDVALERVGLRSPGLRIHVRVAPT